MSTCKYCKKEIPTNAKRCIECDAIWTEGFNRGSKHSGFMKTHDNHNPIFIEYYSHEGCDCYKIRNPWTKYRSGVQVLCPVGSGLEFAKLIARGIIIRCLEESLTEEIE